LLLLIKVLILICLATWLNFIVPVFRQSNPYSITWNWKSDIIPAADWSLRELITAIRKRQPI